MNNTRTILLALTLLTALGASAAGEPFTVTLPEGYAPFAAQTQKVESPEGQIETTNWISRAPTGEAVVVTMSVMPGPIQNPEKMIASTRESLLESLSATLESEEKRDGELPVARLLFRSDAAVFRSRFVVDKDRFYQLLYVGRSDEQRNAPAVAQVFESFQLAKAE
jgi:hypothetical protein